MLVPVSVLASVQVRQSGDVNVVLLLVIHSLMNLGRGINKGADVSMISVLQHHDVLSAGVRRGKSEREVVGLGAGVGEVTHVERLGHCVQQRRHEAGQEVRGEALKVKVSMKLRGT